MNPIGLFIAIVLIGFYQFSEMPHEDERLTDRLQDRFNDYPISDEIVYTTLNRYMCGSFNILPKGYKLPFEPKDIYFLPVVAVSGLLLFFAIFMKPKGFFKTLFYMIYSGLLVLVFMCSLILFVNYTKIPFVCETVKPVILEGYKMLTNLDRFIDVAITNNVVLKTYVTPYVQPLMKTYAPHTLQIISAQVNGLIEFIKKCPAVLMIIGAFLLRKKGEVFTKLIVIPFILSVSVIRVNIALFMMKVPYIEICTVSSIVLILMIFAINGLLKYGHLIMLPILLINATSVLLTMFRIFNIEVFILFMIVITVTLIYCYMWSKGSDVMAAVVFYIGYSAIFPTRSGIMLVAIFFLTGLFA